MLRRDSLRSSGSRLIASRFECPEDQPLAGGCVVGATAGEPEGMRGPEADAHRAPRRHAPGDEVGAGERIMLRHLTNLYDLLGMWRSAPGRP